MKINDPPTSVETLKASVGIDSVYLQFKGINKFDSDRFCREYELSYTKNKIYEYTREWNIFLSGGHPITVVYHRSSKTLTFQIGGFMNYSIVGSEQHNFAQMIMQFFSNTPVKISGIDFAFDVKKSWSEFLVDKAATVKFSESTVYFNSEDKTVLCIYDKATLFGIFSIPLTRFELRLRGQLCAWSVKDIMESQKSIEKLASKVETEFDEKIKIFSVDAKKLYSINYGDLRKIIENFIAFLQGAAVPPVKDHFKVKQALEKKTIFFDWVSKNKLKANMVDKFIKLRRAQVLSELGMDAKTFKKAVTFYKANPNIKFGGHPETPTV